MSGAKLPTVVYTLTVFEILKTDAFDRGLRSLRDRRAVARINARLRQVSIGALGDAKPVCDGVSELRVFYGPGYRPYFIRQGAAIIVLLCGGDKSTQAPDIARAKAMAGNLTE